VRGQTEPGLVAYVRHPSRKRGGSILTTPEPALADGRRVALLECPPGLNSSLTSPTAKNGHGTSDATLCLGRLGLCLGLSPVKADIRPPYTCITLMSRRGKCGSATKSINGC